MRNFLCPKCDGHLRIGDFLVFKIMNSDKKKALIFLSPQIGNYSSIKHPEYKVDKGELLEFYCPLCNNSLKSDVHQDLVQITMMDGNRNFFDVYFSRINGEHCAYETKDELIRIEGEDAGKYTFFKIGQKYKKYF